MHVTSEPDPSFVLGQVIAARRILAHLESDSPDIPEDQYCIVMMWLSAWAADIQRRLGALRDADRAQAPATSAGVAA